MIALATESPIDLTGDNSSSSTSNDSTVVAVDATRILAGQYEVVSRLGSGSFGEVYRAVDLWKNQPVAVKVEARKSKPIGLEREYIMLDALAADMDVQSPAAPHVHWFGANSTHQVMVMDLLGVSVEEVFAEVYGHRFPTYLACSLARQVLRHLAYIHGRGIVHGDVKPENILFQQGSSTHVSLVDLGLGSSYVNANGNHIAMNDEFKSFTGTPRFASSNVHAGYVQTRRDDLISWAFMLVYWLKGRLPWQGVRQTDKMQRLQQVAFLKQRIPTHVLCESLHPNVETIVTICQALKFDEVPPYAILESLVSQMIPVATETWPEFVLPPTEEIKQPDSAFAIAFDSFVHKEVGRAKIVSAHETPSAELVPSKKRKLPLSAE